MGTISLSLPSDGNTIDASDVNTPFNTISAVINGNLDDDNIKTGANISGTKLGALTTPLSALDANGRGGWITGVLAAPTTITYNGNGSYDMVFNSVDYTDELSNGMRLKCTRTVTAPTQCTSLNGTTQYWEKTSPAGMTWTDDFAVGRWIYLTSYTAAGIESRYNGTSGWDFTVQSTGQIRLAGCNAGAGNTSYVQSNQSVPLNKWVFVSAQLDMSSFTATTTTSYVMIGGIDIPAVVARAGTNPTALVQAGNYQIGATNSTAFFPGKLGPGGVYSAKVTQSTFRSIASQALSGSETSIAAAINFNGSATDASSNGNTPSAVASATATNADSPFGIQADGTTAGTTEHAIITKTAFSTNTTLTVQVPEGCALPTSGGISAVSYSTQKAPYGFPTQKGKWRLEFTDLNQRGSYAFAAINQWTIATGELMTVPIGNWGISFDATLQLASTVSGVREGRLLLIQTGTQVNSTYNYPLQTMLYVGTGTNAVGQGTANENYNLTVATVFQFYASLISSTGSESYYMRGDGSGTSIYADNAYL